MIDLMDQPNLVHQLLEMTTDAIITSLRFQDQMCDGLRLVLIADHNTANLSPKHCREFLFPYIKAVVDAMPPEMVIIYHNEGRAGHVLDQISECGAHAFHCGDVDLAQAKRLIGDRICLMGNLEAPNFMVKSTPEEVRAESLHCLDIAAPGGGFVLTTGGGHDPFTPKENIRAMVDSVSEWHYDRVRSDGPLKEQG
jgi:uroporphyrinogen decarboxylase